jgi:hypothetical protein
VADRRFDAGAVVAGLLFGGAAACFLVQGITGDAVLGIRTLVAAVFCGLGVIGVVRAVGRVRRVRRPPRAG